ncbi:MAG TPA: endopeptidase La [Acidobacteriota bacterium]
MEPSQPNRIDESKFTPLVPLRDVIVFPYMMMPFVVGRRKSILALEHALLHGKRILLATQKDAATDDPGVEEIFRTGTIANIVQSLKLPNGNIKVLVEGIERAQILEFRDNEEFHEALVRTAKRKVEVTATVEKAMQGLLSLFEQYIKLSQSFSYEAMISAVRIDDPDRLTDTISAHLMVDLEEKQALLEMFDPVERLNRIAEILEIEIEKLQVDKRIQGRVKKQMEKAQREYYLNEKLKAIQKELGKKDNRNSDLEELRKKIETKKMPKEAREKAQQELERLEAMPAMSAESTVSRNYLDWLLGIPWEERSRENRSLKRAEKVLQQDHFGLEKVKERILEFLAVRQLVKKQKGSILCFVGPPGVGKSSLAKSIARSTGRRFVRLSLGGVRDEAEIRGHRRTYIGAYPGQIVQLMKKATTVNPVFLLDEVDKMSMDFRGDPSAALLEVLDPEQNNSFVDHYLDTEYDLSHVMFIATANVLHTIPRALQDRMEVIRLSGYTLKEKIEIAKRHLIAKQLQAHGLHKRGIRFTEEALQRVIENYTREAGVRNLEREIANICRKLARQIVTKRSTRYPRVVTGAAVERHLGVPRFRSGQKEKIAGAGLATGLAWTEMGGELLNIEATLMPGKGRLNITGKLGEVMQESAHAALSYVRSNAAQFGIPRDFHRSSDIHIHVPEGAIPKDGPSAGIAIATALVSALAGVPVRDDVAMTGEITLRGRVLPIGGVKEKLLAAHRAEILRVLLPRENEKDLSEIPEEVRRELKIELVENMKQVLDAVLVSKLTPLIEPISAYQPGSKHDVPPSEEHDAADSPHNII